MSRQCWDLHNIETPASHSSRFSAGILYNLSNKIIWDATTTVRQWGYDTATSCRLSTAADVTLYSLPQSLLGYVWLRWSECNGVWFEYEDVQSLLFSLMLWFLFSKSCKRSEWYMSRLSVDCVSSCRSNCRGDKSLALMNVFLIRTACRRHCSASGIFFSLLMLCFSIFVLFSLNLLMITLQGFSIGSRNGSLFFELRNLTMLSVLWVWYRLQLSAMYPAEYVIYCFLSSD